MMLFDLHCHTKEGSIDAKVELQEYIDRLKSLGFDGMLVTDHDSYKGFRKWKKIREDNPDFVVVKGIEYDTKEAGHMIVVMPDGIKAKVLEVRGLPLIRLIDIVHRLGGIVGPAHPYGEKYLSIMSTGQYRYDDTITTDFDFIETFNSCEKAESNAKANRLADKYHKVKFAGSDAHCMEGIGRAKTYVDAEIKTANDLIKAVKAHCKTEVGGSLFVSNAKKKIAHIKGITLFGFLVYNRGIGLAKMRKRKKKLEELKEKHLNKIK